MTSLIDQENLGMSARKWARIKSSGPHGLRRGAWYRVVNDADPDLLVLDVNRKQVRLQRSAVELASERPLMWTVVDRDRSEATTPGAEPGTTHGVCPNCLTRATLKPDDTNVQCPSCGLRFAVDWD